MPRFDGPSGQTNDGANRQYLTFLIGAEEYGVEILKVQEVKGFSAVTPVPNAPRHVIGVMNLRGTIIPVIDPRCTFGFPTIEYTRNNVIVILTVGAKVMGLVVDAVSDVINLAPDEVQEAPDFGRLEGDRSIQGLGRAGDKVVLLLDVERMLGVGAASLQLTG